MVDTWPGGVNQAVLMDSFNRVGDDNGVVSQQPKVGPPQRRRRSSVLSEMFTFAQLLTFAEFETLNTFYVDTLKNGVLPFTRLHPISGATITCTFEKRFQSGQPVSATKFRVMFELRVYL